MSADKKIQRLSSDRSDYKVCDTPLTREEVAQVSTRPFDSWFLQQSCKRAKAIAKCFCFGSSADLRSCPCSLNQAPSSRQANLKSFISKFLGTPMLVSGRSAPGTCSDRFPDPSGQFPGPDHKKRRRHESVRTEILHRMVDPVIKITALRNHFCVWPTFVKVLGNLRATFG